MIKSLIKATNEVRVETEEDADNFHKELQEEADRIGCTLSTFTKTLKQKKLKGEIMEEYYQIKYTFVFNELKEPETYLSNIEYNMINQVTETTQEDVPW